MTRKVIAKSMVVVLTFVVCVIGGTPVLASTESTEFGHYFKHAGTLYDRTVTLAGNETMISYDHTEACPSAHKTRQDRNYWHSHIRHSLPKDVMVNGAMVSITDAKVVDFWDVEYAGYDGTGQGGGGWDTSKNCHGYAFNAGTWCTGVGMDSLERYKTDYVWTAGSGSDNGLDGWCAEGSYTHAIKSKWKLLTCTIASTPTPVTKIIETKEKFYDSPIYSKSGGSCTVSITLKPRFEYKDINLPAYTTYNDCQMCHTP